MAWKGLESEELVQNLRQLLISFEPQLREAGSAEQAEDCLLHLEENDENFHRYEFVKQLKRKIEELLGPQIEEEIEKQATAGHVDNGQDTLVTKIIDSIIKSKPYNEIRKKLRGNVSEAVNDLMRNFDAEFGLGHHGGHFPNRPDRGGHFHGSDEEESSCDSSYNQGSLMFMNSEFSQQLAEKMSKTKSTEVRREALQGLNQINQINDVINCDQFPQIRKHLLDSLSDTDEQIVNLSHKFVTRAFTTTSHHTKDIYTLLAEHLISQFHSRRSNMTMPKIKNGLDVSKPQIVRLLKCFRLMNEFQHETINYWIRYPEMYLEEVLESTLNLLSIHHMGPVGLIQQLTPLHFVALLDTKAQWFIKWMHGNFSRSVLLDLLTKYKSLVENAVKHCLEFSAARKVPFDLMSDISEAMSRASLAPQSQTRGSYDLGISRGREKMRTFYTGSELEYAYFIHSACVVGKLLCFTNGRKFFPIKLRDSDDTVSIKKLMVALVLVVVDPSPVFHSAKSSSAEVYDPAKIVTEILKGLCSSEQACEICLFKDEITSTLLSPISHFLDVADHQAPTEKTLLHVADILSMIASSTKGRRHLIYGERNDVFTRTKSSAAHIIAEFTKKALQGQLPQEAGPPPSHAVIGAYLYICRQIYNTCEGLLVLYPYELHKVIAESWQQASQDLESSHTPTPGNDDDSSSDNSSITIREPYDMAQWEDTLRDNLLNFASTAKGILLLQQTGALNECMLYMHTRYEKKLQTCTSPEEELRNLTLTSRFWKLESGLYALPSLVIHRKWLLHHRKVSQCEKFGYGYMVTQVAATAPGMAALEKTGYIKALISELWSVLECGPSDVALFTPKSWPVDPIERTSHKHLIRLLNLLSSFPAVYELLADRTLPNKENYSFREMPDTIVGLVDRLIIMDRPSKSHSLFNMEQSHVFGLRVLSVMTSCLDSYLLLQSQYRLQECLLAAQTDNQIGKDNKEVIVDMLSVERNNILVRTYLMGGPSERILPKRHISLESDQPYPFPLFSSYPIPREYSPNLGGRSAMKQENELTKFLDSHKGEKGRAWLSKCQTLLCKFLTTKGDQVKGNVIQKLLEQSIAVLSTIPEESIYPLIQYSGTDSALKSVHISPLQQLGIKMAIRYGIHLKVIHTTSDATERLSHLIRQVVFYLRQQQKTVESGLRYLQNSYPGFDWFAATVFMVFNGNEKKSWDFLQNFSTLGASGYLWLPRLHASVHIPSALSSSGIPPIFSSTGHNIEFVLQTELPLVSSAFKMSGYTPAQISLHWLKQCFWNYMDWLDICHYIVICLILGIDYQVYICVAIFKHLQRDIMSRLQTQDLIMLLKEEPLHNFKVAKNLKYMQELEEKYRKMILPDMMNITKP